MLFIPVNNFFNFIRQQPVVPGDFSIVLIEFSVSFTPVIKPAFAKRCFRKKPAQGKFGLFLDFMNIINDPISQIRLNPTF
jgi:hypothetical protein